MRNSWPAPVRCDADVKSGEAARWLANFRLLLPAHSTEGFLASAPLVWFRDALLPYASTNNQAWLAARRSTRGIEVRSASGLDNAPKLAPGAASRHREGGIPHPRIRRGTTPPRPPPPCRHSPD